MVSSDVINYILPLNNNNNNNWSKISGEDSNALHFSVLVFSPESLFKLLFY